MAKVMSRDGVTMLPPEQGARRRSQDFWTTGPTFRERSRSPWDARNYPKPKPYVIRPIPDDFRPNWDTMQPWERDYLRRVREGRQWASRAKNLAREGLNRGLAVIRVADTVGALVGYKQGALEIPDVKFPGYLRCDGPYGPIDEYDPPNGMWYAPGSLHCTNFQLTGQGFGSGAFAYIDDIVSQEGETNMDALFGVTGSRPGQFMLGWTREGGARWIEQSSWVLQGAEDAPFTAIVTVQAAMALDEMTDPNIERLTESQPQAMMQPNVQPALVPLVSPWGVDYAFPEVHPQLAAEVAAWPDAMAWSTPMSMTSAGPNTKPAPMIRVPTAPIAPPKAGEKQRKTISRSKALSVAAFKVLDGLSEAADIVDAVYEALPDDVRDRWKCDGGRGPVDNFGQYGVSHADCKLQALWHNWHRLDAEQAVVNIVKNELQDRVYGAIHKHLPKQAGGPALNNAWKAFAKGLKGLGL